MKYKDIEKILENEIKFCLNHKKDIENIEPCEEYRAGFIAGLFQAKFLLGMFNKELKKCEK